MHLRSLALFSFVILVVSAAGCREAPRGVRTDAGPRMDGSVIRDSGPPPAICDGSTTDENTAALCGDGCDNDGNGFADCMDFSCSQNSAVTVCADAVENTYDECSNGLDDDGDGFADCADFSQCAPPDRTPNIACR